MAINLAEVEATFLPQFDSITAHGILISGLASATYIGKKLIDLIAEVVKRKLEERDAARRWVIVYDHRNRPYRKVEVKSVRQERSVSQLQCLGPISDLKRRLVG